MSIVSQTPSTSDGSDTDPNDNSIISSDNVARNVTATWDSVVGGTLSKLATAADGTVKIASSEITSQAAKGLGVINKIGTAVDKIAVTLWDTIFPANESTTDPLGCYRYLTMKNEALRQNSQLQPLIRIWDRNMNFIGRLQSVIEAEWEELSDDSGQATITILRDNWLGNYLASNVRVMQDLHMTIDPDIHARNWRTRWGGKIVSMNFKKTKEGEEFIEFQCIHNREHLKHILIGTTPIFPAEVQPIRMWVLPGPTRTVVATSLFVNLARIFFPVLNVVSNVMNPLEWTTERFGNFMPLNWPLQVSFIDPLLDQSRWTVIGSRWNDCHSVCDQLLKDAGCVIRAYTWLPEDEDSPQQELNAATSTFDSIGQALALLEHLATNAVEGALKGAKALFDEFADVLSLNSWAGDVIINEAGDIIGAASGDLQWFTQKTGQGVARVVNLIGRPWRPAVVFAVEDKSGVTGPTGTVADGLINLIAATGDDLITESIFPIDLDHDGKTDPVLRRLAWVAPKQPKVIFRDEKFVGVDEAQRIVHKCQAITAMVGGKSPGWVNDAQTFGITYAISKIQEIFYMAQYEDGIAPNLPASMGLDNIYQGQLDDILLAWQRVTDPSRALTVGDYAFQEVFQQSSGTGWTLSAQLSLRQGLWTARPYISFKVDMLDGLPWYINKDFTLGDRVGFVLNGVIFVDNCHAVKGSFSKAETMKWQCSIGQDTEEEDPVGKAMRVAAMAWNFIGTVVGSSDLF